MEAIVVDDDTDEPMPEDDAEFAARDEQTLADYAANPYGFTAGMKFKGGVGARLADRAVRRRWRPVTPGRLIVWPPSAEATRRAVTGI